MRSRVLESGTIIRVQTWNCEAAVPAAVHDALGVAWPRQVGATTSGRAEVLCVGPTDWLVLSAAADATDYLQRLERALTGSAFRTTNLSHALTRLELSGPEVRDLLAKGCSLDLHTSQFAPGRAARTRFAGMPVIVRCTAPSTFECIVTQSYAQFLWNWIEDALSEFDPAT